MTYIIENMKSTLEIKNTEKNTVRTCLGFVCFDGLLLYRFKFTDFVLWTA